MKKSIAKFLVVWLVVSDIPLRSGHLDIKDAQYATYKDGRKISYHNISRLGAAGKRSKRGVVGARKFHFLKKWPNLQGRLELT